MANHPPPFKSSFYKAKTSSPFGIFLLKVNIGNTRTMCEICSELTIKTTERYQWRLSGIFIVNFKHILHIALVFPFWLWTSKCWLDQHSQQTAGPSKIAQGPNTLEQSLEKLQKSTFVKVDSTQPLNFVYFFFIEGSHTMESWDPHWED